MTAFALTDCIRSTPSRTIGALLVAAWSTTGRALRARGHESTILGVSDRTLADIGVSRVMVNVASLSSSRSGPSA